MKNKRGITLVALVITIIIMMILVAITVTASLGDNGVVGRTQKAEFESDIAKYREELALYLQNAKAEAEINNTEFIDITEWDYDTIIAEKYIPSLDKKYSGRIGIIESKLAFLDTEDRKSRWAAGIDGLIIKSIETKIKVCIEGEGSIQGIDKINEEIVTKVGKEYTLTATAGTKQDISYTFVEWQKDGKTVSTNASYTFQVGGDSTYTAVFTPEATIITYLKEGKEEYLIDRTSNLATYMSEKATIEVANIIKVEFGNGCIEIPNGAFSNCINLKSINLKNVTSIPCALNGNTSLEEVIAPKVTSILDSAFYGDKNLKKVEIGSKDNPVTYIQHQDAFYGCTSNDLITKIYIDNSNENNVLLNNSWATRMQGATIEYYDSVTAEIIKVIQGLNYKGNAEITWEDVPNKDKITEIKSNAFNGCTSITNVELSETVKSIGSGAFSNCINLKSINLKNVTSIPCALNGNTSLEEVIAPKVTSILDSAFYGDENLKKVEIGSKDNPVTYIQHQDAFYGCTSTEMIIKIFVDTSDTTNNIITGNWTGRIKGKVEYYDSITGEKIEK